MNMNTTDKVQVGDPTVSSTSTSTNTSTTWHCPYTQHKAEQGWECPRCGHINAPWVRQCDCSRSNWTITSDWTYKPDLTYKPEWWKDYVTCGQADDVTKNPNIYQVGGSDYKVGDTYVNVGGTQSNKVNPNVTAWNCTNPDIAVNDFTTYRTDVPKTYTTETMVNDGINNFYNLKTSKETK